MENTDTIVAVEKNNKVNEILIIGLKKFNIYDPGYLGSAIQAKDITFSKAEEVLSRSKKLPKAIICNFELLKKDDFKLLGFIKNHSRLKLLPFIAITDKINNVNIKEALMHGVDDCYSYDANPQDILKRIEFLRRYKKDLLASNEASIQNTEYKIPLGKRIFDIAFASAVLLAFSPILLIIAILIKIESRGSVFYLSKRAGTGYQIFDFIKFRSMCEGADGKLAQVVHLNQYQSNGAASSAVSFVKIKNDPRITKIGRFIRKTSLDELPQLINVLRGEMSIVGNRPLPLYEAEQLTKDDWAKRFIAPAGLTGLWQINKQSDTLDEEARIGLDIEYAENYSFAYDLKIILKTLPAMLQKDEE